MRYLKNTISVLVVTALTAIALYSAVELLGRTTQATASFATQTSATSGGQTYVCPRTGCTASTCHGATGSPPPTSGGGGGQQAPAGTVFE